MFYMLNRFATLTFIQCQNQHWIINFFANNPPIILNHMFTLTVATIYFLLFRCQQHIHISLDSSSNTLKNLCSATQTAFWI